MSTLNITGNQDLAGWIQRLGPSVGHFVYRRLFPEIQVPEKEGNFLRQLQGFGAADPADGIMRAAGDPHYKQVDIAFDRTTGWALEDLGLSTPVDRVYDDRFGDADLKVIRVRRVKASELHFRYHLGLERIAIAAATDTSSVFTGDNTDALITATQWDNYDSATSDPVENADQAREVVENGTGYAILPNGERDMSNGVRWVATMNAATFRKLRKHPKVLSNVQTNANLVQRASLAQVAQALDVDEVIIAGGKANSAAPGAAESVAALWPNSVGFYLLQPSVTPQSPQTCLGRFVMDDGVDLAVNTERISDKVDSLYLGRPQQFQVPVAAAGFVLTNVLSS